MKRISSIIFIMLFILTLAFSGINSYAANAGDVWVSDSGNDSGAGTSSSPYATMTKAMSAVSDNGTIHITGTLTLPASFKWNAGSKTITITGGTLNGKSLNGTRLDVGGDATFTNITIDFNKDNYIFANGHNVIMGEGITMTNPINLFGGGISSTTLESTNLTVLSGTYTAIYGGSNKGKITGDTHLYVGGNVNAGLDVTSHSGTNNVYGGGYDCTISGSTYLTFTENARAIYVFGGGNGASTSIGGCANSIFAGYAMSYYGGNNNSSDIKNVFAQVVDGEVEQVFGANQAASMTGDVDLRVLGGKVTRRIYGGCYNEADAGLFSATWKSSYHVSGNITLTIGSATNITLDDNDNDRGIFANSRHKTAFTDEVSAAVFKNADAYNKYNGKLGQKDSIASFGGISPPSCDTKHCYTYTVSGSTVTQTCSQHTSHSATATLTIPSSQDLSYTGYEIRPVEISYDSAWEYLPLSDITYSNNVNVGTATATCTVSNVEVSISFNIEKTTPTSPWVDKTDETVFGKADGHITRLTTAMEYSTDGVSYTPVTDTSMSLAAGIYYVRYAETDNCYASDASVLSIEAGEKLTVTFKAQGQADIVKELAWNETLTDIPAVPEKIGHTAAWSVTDFSNITENITITAVYTANKMTITFIADGQTVATKTIDYGTALTDIPAVPAKEGHTATWIVTDLSNVTDNITVTVIYTPLPPVDSDTTTDTESATDTEETIVTEDTTDTESNTEAESTTVTEPSAPSEDTLGQTESTPSTDATADSAAAPQKSGCGSTVIGGMSMIITSILGVAIFKRKEDQ